MRPREVGEEESREKRVQKSYFLKLSGHVGALKRCSLTIKASVLTQLSSVCLPLNLEHGGCNESPFATFNTSPRYVTHPFLSAHQHTHSF